LQLIVSAVSTKMFTVAGAKQLERDMRAVVDVFRPYAKAMTSRATDRTNARRAGRTDNYLKRVKEACAILTMPRSGKSTCKQEWTGVEWSELTR
jgi:hypothetical protein